jgi:hypothetical protein
MTNTTKQDAERFTPELDPEALADGKYAGPNGEYVYVGPDGDLVNRDIDSDRTTHQHNEAVRNHKKTGKIVPQTPDNTLTSRSENEVLGGVTAKEVVKAIGMREARAAEGRSV